MTGRPAIEPQAIDTILRSARSHTGWREEDVADSLLHAIWDIAKMGPTSANCCPLRIVFIRSKEAKEKLCPALAEGNVDKMMAAPVTAIFAHDLAFYDRLPELFPHTDARSWFVGKPDLIAETAMRNSSLQAAYVMLAARALGLDCGPMSGFDAAIVDRLFFAGTEIRSNFLCNLGIGDPAKLKPGLPRPDFDSIARIE